MKSGIKQHHIVEKIIIQFDRKGKKKGYEYCEGWSHGTGSEVSICYRSIYLSEPVLKTLSSNVSVKNSVDVVLR